MGNLEAVMPLPYWWAIAAVFAVAAGVWIVKRDLIPGVKPPLFSVFMTWLAYQMYLWIGFGVVATAIAAVVP